jgi:signal transduction histidine kinase
MTLQIIWNLLGNDLKYAAPYGRVAVRFSRTASEVYVEFIDEGQGMSGYQMAHAFDRYYRASTVLKTGKGGFGIGLCSARDFARSMRGDLTVRSNVPNGCVFTLKLPCG